MTELTDIFLANLNTGGGPDAWWTRLNMLLYYYLSLHGKTAISHQELGLGVKYHLLSVDRKLQIKGLIIDRFGKGTRTAR